MINEKKIKFGCLLTIFLISFSFYGNTVLQVHAIQDGFYPDDFNAGIGTFWTEVYPTGTDDWDWVVVNGRAVPKLLSGRDNYAYTYLEQIVSNPIAGTFDVKVEIYKYATSTSTQLQLRLCDRFDNLIACGGIYDPWASSYYKEYAVVYDDGTSSHSWQSNYLTVTFSKQVHIWRDTYDVVHVEIGGEERISYVNTRPLESIQLYIYDKWAASYDGELVGRTDRHWFDNFEFSTLMYYPRTVTGGFANPDNVKVDDGNAASASSVGTYLIATNYDFETTKIEELYSIKVQVEACNALSVPPVYFKIGIKLPSEPTPTWSSEQSCESTYWNTFTYQKSYNHVEVDNPSNIELWIKITNNPIPIHTLYLDYVAITYEAIDVKLISASVIGQPRKSDDIDFKISLKNVGNVLLTDIQIRIKIDPIDYIWNSQWDHYICDWLDWNNNLAPGIQEDQVFTFPAILYYMDYRIAWNVGDYEIEQVDVRYKYQGSQNFINDSLTSGYIFSVDPHSIHKVFCVVIQDPGWVQGYGSWIQDWKPGVDSDLGDEAGYGASDWSHEPWYSTDWYYNSRYNIDLVPAVIDLYDFQQDNSHLAPLEGFDRTRVILGMECYWDGEEITTGKHISPLNHGFDLLWIMLPHGSIGTSHGGWNRIVHVADTNPTHKRDVAFHVLQHELGHVFEARHIEYFNYSSDTYAIMGKHDKNYTKIWASHKFVSQNGNLTESYAGQFDERNSRTTPVSIKQKNGFDDPNISIDSLEDWCLSFSEADDYEWDVGYYLGEYHSYNQTLYSGRYGWSREGVYFTSMVGNQAVDGWVHPEDPHVYSGLMVRYSGNQNGRLDDDNYYGVYIYGSSSTGPIIRLERRNNGAITTLYEESLSEWPQYHWWHLRIEAHTIGNQVQINVWYSLIDTSFSDDPPNFSFTDSTADRLLNGHSGLFCRCNYYGLRALFDDICLEVLPYST